MSEKIVIRGAKQHNLKNVSLELPKNELIVFTGVSGSGKSSLAFDTIFAEGQRRYIESLSVYARQIVGQLDKPDVESIDGLSPAIAIDQQSSFNSRYNYRNLRLFKNFVCDNRQTSLPTLRKRSRSSIS